MVEVDDVEVDVVEVDGDAVVVGGTVVVGRGAHGGRGGVGGHDAPGVLGPGDHEHPDHGGRRGGDERQRGDPPQP